MKILKGLRLVRLEVFDFEIERQDGATLSTVVRDRQRDREHIAKRLPVHIDERRFIEAKLGLFQHCFVKTKPGEYEGHNRCERRQTCTNIEKIQRLLGYEVKENVESGIKKAVKWYKEN